MSSLAGKWISVFPKMSNDSLSKRSWRKRHIQRQNRVWFSKTLNIEFFKASDLPPEQYSVEAELHHSVICLWFLIFVKECEAKRLHKNARYHGISSGTLWTRVIRELKMHRHPLKLNAFTIPLNMELCLWANSNFEISLPATVFLMHFSVCCLLPSLSWWICLRLWIIRQ